MPKLIELLGFSIFIWSNEGKPLEPVHVHVGKVPNKNATKFWILSDGTAQLDSNGSKLTVKELRRIVQLIEENAEFLIAEWENYFQVKATYYDETDA